MPKSIDPLIAMALTGATPFSVTTFIGVTGSSLLMVIVAIRVPVAPTGIKLTMTVREPPGGMTNGNVGGETSLNSVELNVIPATVRLHSPVFLITSGSVFEVFRQTSPKSSGSGAAWITGGGTVPTTLTFLFGVTGSLLIIVRVAICIGSAVKPIGMNWIVTSRVWPAGMISGNGTTPMTLNTGELEVMPVTIRSQLPLLPMVNVWLIVTPGQVLSKVIGSLTTMTGCPPCALNVRMTAGLTGSLELTVNVLVLLPALVAVKQAWNGKQKSGRRITGKPAEGWVPETCRWYA